MAVGRVLSTPTRLRIGITVLVLLVTAVDGTHLDVLPWALLIVALDLVTGAVLALSPPRPHDRRAVALTLTVSSAVIAGLAVTAGGGAVLLGVVPLLRAGECWGARVVTATLVAFALPASLAWSRADPDGSSAGRIAVWTALAAAIWALAAWAGRGTPRPAPQEALGAEATWLLTRLESLASEMGEGWDPVASAEHLLDALPRRGPTWRSGVLIGAPTDRPVPLALRGCARVPWPDPRGDHGVLGAAWHHGRAGVVTLEDGRVQVAVPLRDARERQFGVVVSDGTGAGAAPADLLASTSAVAGRHQSLVAVALAFGALRERAGIEERQRLARRMHDGIAQELVALGFRVDRAKRLPDELVRPELIGLRAEVGRILGDVRTQIGDLRLPVPPEGGLGAAITSQLQVFRAATGAVVNTRLSESPYRLPAHVETGLYRVVLDFLADARRAVGADGLEVGVSLRTEAPDARMVLRQTGRSDLTEPGLSAHLPASIGAAVTVTSSSSGTEIVVHLTAVPGAPAVLGERLPQAS